MALLHAAVFFGVLTGIVSAGLVSSLWSLAAGDSPRFTLLRDTDFLTPLKVVIVVFSAPMIVLSRACWWTVERPVVGVPLFVLGLLWSFLQGVFILTQVFNIT